jgi:hypothetical protein
MLGNFSAAGSRGVALPPPRVAYFARNARPLGGSQSCGVQDAALDATQAQPRPRTLAPPSPPADRSGSLGVPPVPSPQALALPSGLLALPKPPPPIKRGNF